MATLPFGSRSMEPNGEIRVVDITVEVTHVSSDNSPVEMAYRETTERSGNLT